MVLTLSGVLSADDLHAVHGLLPAAPWEDGRASAGQQAAQVKNNTQLPHDCEAATLVRSKVLQGLDRHALFFSAALPKQVFTPRVNRYGGEHNHYGRHVDGAVRVLPSGQRLRTDLSCTVFLNEPTDYDGGELAIADTFGERLVKLRAGDALLYPGTSVHQVLPVTRGVRYACFFWVQSLVRSDEQRRLLYDLDMNLLALRAQHGETAETTALTGVYHNLLRLWVDT